MSQIFGAGQIFLIGWIMDVNVPKKGAFISICTTIGCLIVTFIASLLITEDLRRQKHDSHTETKTINPSDPVINTDDKHPDHPALVVLV